VGVVDLLAHHAQLAGQPLDQQPGVGGGLAGRRRLFVELGGHGFQRVDERADRLLQLGVLLLQHPDLGHHLLMLFVGRGGGRRDRDDGQRDAGGERRQAVAGVEGSDSHG
jgi:hypothetical protein